MSEDAISHAINDMVTLGIGLVFAKADGSLEHIDLSEALRPDACPVCQNDFAPGDICATDIELGTCHAACLEGTPTVYLDTGEPSEGPIDTFPFEAGA